MRIPWWVWALAALVLVGGLVSPFASSLPDGLERVMEREGIAVDETEQPAPLPDYGTPGVGNERASVFLAAAVGIVVVFAVTLVVGRLLSRRQATGSASTPETEDTP